MEDGRSEVLSYDVIKVLSLLEDFGTWNLLDLALGYLYIGGEQNGD